MSTIDTSDWTRCGAITVEVRVPAEMSAEAAQRIEAAILRVIDGALDGIEHSDPALWESAEFSPYMLA